MKEYLPKEKGCKGCNKIKLQSEFSFSGKNPDGLEYFCKSCDYKRHKIKRLQSYGLTENDYNVLLIKQGSICLICGQPEAAKNRLLSVDHDHKTGKVRGLLCRRCNSGLGKFNDDPKLLRKAAKHVEE